MITEDLSGQDQPLDKIWCGVSQNYFAVSETGQGRGLVI